MENFFPFTVHGNSYYSVHFGGGVHAFRKVFYANSPKTIEVVEKFGTFEHKRTERFSIYCFDVVILSPTEVEFICFDMLDNLYGGRGKKFHQFKVECPREIIEPYISERLVERAIARRNAELELKEMEIVAGYAGEERRSLGL